MTSVFTFKVTMAVEVVAENREDAEGKLDEHGGYVTARKVEYMTTTSIPKVDLDK
jgi:hypothetical protein